MKHSLNELLAVVYRFYPRGIDYLDERFAKREERAHLVAARRQAGVSEQMQPWRDLLHRLDARFPERSTQNRSIHLPGGSFDACYAAWFNRVEAQEDSQQWCIGFVVSFLVPYYVVYRTRIVDLGSAEPEPAPGEDPGYFFLYDTFVYYKPWTGPPPLTHWKEIEFTFPVEEQGYAAAVIAEIEATFPGHAPMPPDVGCQIVPDVVTGTQPMGLAMLYHCLFTDDW